MKSAYDVVVVGYGPVGAVLAKLLATGGLDVLVVDKAADIFDKPRAIGIDHEAMRILLLRVAADLFAHAHRPGRLGAATAHVLAASTRRRCLTALAGREQTFLHPQLNACCARVWRAATRAAACDRSAGPRQDTNG